MKPSVEIAQEARMKPIVEIAGSLALTEEDLELYGKFKAKISLRVMERLQNHGDGRLIVVTGITPTPAGEGKTTTAIGLAQALWRLKKKSIVCIREPSVGPLFGVKGGATGGGYAQVLPMEDINLHFTGDIHAVTAANNLLAAMLDNHLFQGNELNLDPERIIWKRAMDMNDRALRRIEIGVGGKSGFETRIDSFEITAASEVMAALGLATSLKDLKERLGNIIVGFSKGGEPIIAHQLGANGAMTLLLKDALKPNLVQTIENTPAIVHGGPFANIAHGCPTILSIRFALKLADYVMVEPGFGSELGAEKFFDIVCRIGGFRPNGVVLVASVRALKLQGGGEKEKIIEENVDALQRGLVNLDKHVENLHKFGIPVVVAINKFPTDFPAEIEVMRKHCQFLGVSCAVSEVVVKGGEGGLELASVVLDVVDKNRPNFDFLYPVTLRIKDKVKSIAEQLYGAGEVEYSVKAEQSIKLIEAMGYRQLPVCIAKTPISLSDDPKLIGRPRGFTFKVRDLKVSAASGFVVVYAGDILTMPGLPKKPAAENVDIDERGKITGLF